MIERSPLYNRKFLNFPRNITIIFMSFSLFMFFISPWEWPLNNQILFYSINLLYIFSFFIGYKFGISNYKVINSIKTFNLIKWISISLIVNLIFIYPKFLFKLKVPSISFGDLWNNLVIGILTPSIAYASKHQSDFDDFLTLSNPLTFLYFVSLPLQYFSIPFGLYFWEKLKRWEKFAYFLIVVSDIFSYIMIGTNKGLFDYIILIPIILIIKNPHLINFNKIFTKTKIKYFSIFFILLIFGLVYFVEGNKGRKNVNFGYEFSTGIEANRDSYILLFLPSALEDSYIALDSYITTGYYAMGLALEMDHNFTYGLGHNNFFISLGEKVLGQGSILNKTYQVRMEEKFNYSRSTKWHSFYVWMANDLTFLGVALLIFFIAYFLSQIWIDVFNFHNPFGIILLPLFFTIILYFTANNQVLGNQGSSYIFWIFFFLWFNNRGKKFLFR